MSNPVGVKTTNHSGSPESQIEGEAASIDSWSISVKNFGAVGDGTTDDTAAFQRAVNYLKQRKFPEKGAKGKVEQGSPPSISVIRDFITLDLSNGHYLISQPISLNLIYGCILSNGTVTASKDFPIDKYLFDFRAVNTVKVENILLECRKRANGIFAHKFFRLRVEDCTILHQKSYGIHGSRKGYNHELEIFKCNISEYVWGDGKKNKSGETPEIPDFRDAKNRESIGIFLGQADNIVSDCNINLCRVGIKVGMRANRIQGNHITSGGTYSNEIYDGIILDKHIKSSCLIVNNYIDNCRLKLRVNSNKVCKRNYVTVTDNLFYRGFNHPKRGEFNHIVVRPLEENSILQNVIISDNQFYTQDEHLDGQAQRVIKPIHVDTSPYVKDGQGIQPSLNPNQIIGAIVQNNNFTNVHPYYEIPMATRLTGIIDMPEVPTNEYSIDFSKYIPWGKIQSYSATMSVHSSESPVAFAISNIEGNRVIIKTAAPIMARFDVTVDTNSSSPHYDRILPH